MASLSEQFGERTSGKGFSITEPEEEASFERVGLVTEVIGSGHMVTDFELAKLPNLASALMSSCRNLLTEMNIQLPEEDKRFPVGFPVPPMPSLLSYTVHPLGTTSSQVEASGTEAIKNYYILSPALREELKRHFANFIAHTSKRSFDDFLRDQHGLFLGDIQDYLNTHSTPYPHYPIGTEPNVRHICKMHDRSSKLLERSSMLVRYGDGVDELSPQRVPLGLIHGFERRQLGFLIGGIVGTAAGLYTISELQTLKHRVHGNDLLIRSTRAELAAFEQDMDDKFRKLSRASKQLARLVSTNMKATNVNSLVSLLEASVNSLESEVNSVESLLEKLSVNRLPHAFIEKLVLEGTISRAAAVAESAGSRLLANTISDLSQCQASFVIEASTLTVFLHVPLGPLDESTDLPLYQMKAHPFKISEGVIGAFKVDSEMLAISADLSQYRSYTREELEACSQIGQSNFLCSTGMHKLYIPEQTELQQATAENCLLSSYLGLGEAIKRTCELHLGRMKTHISRISGGKFRVITGTAGVRGTVTCRDGSKDSFNGRDDFTISIDPLCVADFQGNRLIGGGLRIDVQGRDWRPDSQLTLDIKNIIDPEEAATLNKTIQAFEGLESITKIRHLASLDGQGRQHASLGIGSFGLILALLCTVFIVFACCAKRKKAATGSQVHNVIMSVPPNNNSAVLPV